MEENTNLSLSQRDIRTIIRALDDYEAQLFKSKCYKDAFYVDRLSRKLNSKVE